MKKFMIGVLGVAEATLFYVALVGILLFVRNR